MGDKTWNGFEMECHLISVLLAFELNRTGTFFFVCYCYYGIGWTNKYIGKLFAVLPRHCDRSILMNCFSTAHMHARTHTNMVNTVSLVKHPMTSSTYVHTQMAYRIN